MKRIMVFLLITGMLFSSTLLWASSDVEKGKDAFEQNGCTGCHKIGTNWNGPDLSSITTYRSKEWLIDFMLNTKKHYEDPEVKAMIQKFNLYMPDQGVDPKDAELIYDYLKSLADAGKKEKH